MKLLEKINTLQTNREIVVDENLKIPINLETNCLGLRIQKDNDSTNLITTLTAVDCNHEALFLCSLPTSQIAIPVNDKKLPCLSKNNGENREIRRKREIPAENKHGNIIQVHGTYIVKS